MHAPRMSKEGSMYQMADDVVGARLTEVKAADKIAGDMKLMRDLFLEAVGPCARTRPRTHHAASGLIARMLTAW